MSNDLEKFIGHARSKGMDHATIRTILLSAGWKEKDIAQALSEEGLDMPVPVPHDAGGARDAFFHLLSFAALYTLLISTGMLLFFFINRYFPDSAEYIGRYDQILSSVRWSMAAVIVSFPLLLWMSKILHKEMSTHPEKAVSGIRRWLTYLTLFIAACTLMGDVITLIFSLLEGELSIRFLLKVITVFALAGLTFTYYFLSLKKTPGQKEAKTLQRNFLSITSVIVVFVLVLSGVIVGSPGKQREKKFDDLRLQHLREISQEIRTIVYGDNAAAPIREVPQPNRPVPSSLEEMLELAVYRYPEIIDPETNVPFEYIVSDEYNYELCAVFTSPRKENYDVFWNHPMGRHCFEIDVRENRHY